jgi:DNA-binding IclR family transcriptional regulator
MSNRTSALAGTPASLELRRTALDVRSSGARRMPAVSIVQRVLGEFAEMRGFSPTLAQAARLFGMTIDECDRVLRSLVHDGSLTCGDDGRYRLAD